MDVKEIARLIDRRTRALAAERYDPGCSTFITLTEIVENQGPNGAEMPFVARVRAVLDNRVVFGAESAGATPDAAYGSLPRVLAEMIEKRRAALAAALAEGPEGIAELREEEARASEKVAALASQPSSPGEPEAPPAGRELGKPAVKPRSRPRKEVPGATASGGLFDSGDGSGGSDGPSGGSAA